MCAATRWTRRELLTRVGRAGGLVIGAGALGCSDVCDVHTEVIDIEQVREDPFDEPLNSIGRVGGALDERLGYLAVGAGGGIWGGRGWTRLQSGTTADLLHVDAVGGWACGTGGTLLRAEEGGASWQAIDAGTRATLRGVASWGARAIVIGEGVARRSFDRGRSWSDVPGAAGLDLRFVVAVASGTFVIVGAHGVVLQVDDTGASATTSPGELDLVGFAEGELAGPGLGDADGDTIAAANGDVFHRDLHGAWIREPTGLRVIAASTLEVVVGGDTIALRDDRGWQSSAVDGTELAGVARSWFDPPSVLELVAVGRRADRGIAVITRWTREDVVHAPHRLAPCTVPE